MEDEAISLTRARISRRSVALEAGSEPAARGILMRHSARNLATGFIRDSRKH